MNRLNILALYAICVALLTIAPYALSAETDTPLAIALKANQTVILALEPETTYLELTAIEDSRCPRDVVCFWEGQAEANFAVHRPQSKEEFSLTLHLNESTSVQIANYTFTIDDVIPYPSTSPSEDAQVKLLVKKN